MSEKNIQSISSQLWAMANELRGNMDAAEFKNYILGFMFYRYLSEHQEDYLIESHLIELEEGKDPNESFKEQIDPEELEDYLEDISSTLGYAIEPKDTWKSLINRINNSQVIPSDYQDIFDNFNKNAELNKEASKDFRGIFNDLNLGDSRLGSTTVARAKSLNNIVKLVDSIDYKGEEGKDVLGEIYEYLIGQFAASAGKKSGEFYTPHQVSVILAKLVTAEWQESGEAFHVYDPTVGSGSLLLTVGEELPGGDKPGAVRYYGQEKNTTTYNLARMNLMMRGVSFTNMELRNADTLDQDWPDGPDSQGIDRPRTFDAVVANPPYSAKWDNNESKLKDPRFNDYGKLAPASKADYAFILHALYHLNAKGTMAIVLPHGVLFRGAAEGSIRKVLIEKNYIDTIIGLPANLFYGTSIPTCILVLKKNRTKKDILFIDASEDYTKAKNKNTLSQEHIDKIINTYKKREFVEKYAYVADLKEIRENEYNLNIPRYVDTFEEEEPIDLEEVKKQLEEDKKEIARLEEEIKEQLKELGLDF